MRHYGYLMAVHIPYICMDEKLCAFVGTETFEMVRDTIQGLVAMVHNQ